MDEGYDEGYDDTEISEIRPNLRCRICDGTGSGWREIGRCVTCQGTGIDPAARFTNPNQEDQEDHGASKWMMYQRWYVSGIIDAHADGEAF